MDSQRLQAPGRRSSPNMQGKHWRRRLLRGDRSQTDGETLDAMRRTLDLCARSEGLDRIWDAQPWIAGGRKHSRHIGLPWCAEQRADLALPSWRRAPAEI